MAVNKIFHRIIFIILLFIIVDNPDCVEKDKYLYGRIKANNYLFYCNNASIKNNPPVNKRENKPHKQNFKPVLKTTLRRNAWTILTSLSLFCSRYVNRTIPIPLKSYISCLAINSSLHKVFLSLESFSIPHNQRKSIIEKNIINC
jgi:hypothetical protein